MKQNQLNSFIKKKQELYAKIEDSPQIKKVACALKLVSQEKGYGEVYMDDIFINSDLTHLTFSISYETLGEMGFSYFDLSCYAVDKFSVEELVELIKKNNSI